MVGEAEAPHFRTATVSRLSGWDTLQRIRSTCIDSIGIYGNYVAKYPFRGKIDESDRTRWFAQQIEKSRSRSNDAGRNTN